MKTILIYLFSIISISASAQIIQPTSSITEINPGPYIHSLNTLSAFLTSTGTASASQSFNFVSGNLSAAVGWKTGSGMEISKDNSTWTDTITFLGSNPSGTVYVRVAAATSAGSYSGNIHGSSGSATADVAYSATVTAVPTLIVNPTSLTGFTSITGSLGGSQSYSLTGTALTGNITVQSPAGYKVSKDNSSFAFQQTVVPVSGSISQTIYVALSDTNTIPGTYSGNIGNSGGGATTKNVTVNGTTSGAASTPDSVKFQFDTTAANNVAGWTIVQGDPSKHIISGTIPNTTITFTTVSTSNSNWGTFGSPAGCIGVNNGVTNATIPDPANSGVMKEAVFTSNLYQTTNAQFVVGGLKTDGTTYDIELSGTTHFSLAAVGNYNVRGSVLQTAKNFNGNANTSSKATWTAITPDAGGNFTFYIGKLTSGEQVALLSYIKITKH